MDSAMARDLGSCGGLAVDALSPSACAPSPACPSISGDASNKLSDTPPVPVPARVSAQHSRSTASLPSSSDGSQSLGDLARMSARMPRCGLGHPNKPAMDVSSGDAAASSRRAPAASGSVHDDNFLQPHGLVVMDLGGMNNKSPFIDDTGEVTHSVTSPSQNSSMASVDLPDHLGLPELDQEPPQPREQSALSAVLQSVASSQAEEMRRQISRQISAVSWAPRDPSGFNLGPIENIPEAATAAAHALPPRPPVVLDPVEEVPAELDALRAVYRPARSTATVSCFGHSTAEVQCSCRPTAASTAAGQGVVHAAAPWATLSAAAACADAGSASARPGGHKLAAYGRHPDKEAAMLQLCGASRSDYSVMFVPPGLPAALQALAHLLGFQKWLPGATMETCPEEGGAKVGSLFRSRSVQLQRQSASCGSVRPVVFYGLHDHELQGEFWSHVDCECVVRPSPNPIPLHPSGLICGACTVLRGVSPAFRCAAARLYQLSLWECRGAAATQVAVCNIVLVAYSFLASQASALQTAQHTHRGRLTALGPPA